MHHSRVPIFLPPNQIWLAAAVQWRSDSDLKLRLKSLVKRGYQRSEILHVMKRDFFVIGTTQITTDGEKERRRAMLRDCVE